MKYIKVSRDFPYINVEDYIPGFLSKGTIIFTRDDGHIAGFYNGDKTVIISPNFKYFDNYNRTKIVKGDIVLFYKDKVIKYLEQDLLLIKNRNIIEFNNIEAKLKYNILYIKIPDPSIFFSKYIEKEIYGYNWNHGIIKIRNLNNEKYLEHSLDKIIEKLKFK